jgi:hypothetical protein
MEAERREFEKALKEAVASRELFDRWVCGRHSLVFCF